MWYWERQDISTILQYRVGKLLGPADLLLVKDLMILIISLGVVG